MAEEDEDLHEGSSKSKERCHRIGAFLEAVYFTKRSDQSHYYV